MPPNLYSKGRTYGYRVADRFPPRTNLRAKKCIHMKTPTFYALLNLLCCSLVFTGFAQVRPTPPQVIVLHAARLLEIESGRILKPGEVLVEGERIVESGSSVAHPAGAQVIDLGNQTLLPGLIDSHVHLFLHPGAEDLQTVEESVPQRTIDRKSTRLNSSHLGISYAVFC